MRCGLPSFFSCSASASIWAQVFGGVLTRSERYHSSWVLLLSGTATSWPFHSAVSSAGWSVPSSASALYLPVHGSIKPALANSASQVTSRPRMSMEESCAASRRTICRRWLSEATGSTW